MKTSLAMLALAVSIASCNKKTENAQAAGSMNDTLAEDSSKIITAGKLPEIHECYKFVQQKDTIALSFEQNGADVKGQMRYKNYEKDSSEGDVSGKFSGDTLKLDYAFSSEGTTSTLELRFLKSGNSLIMGTGDMEDKNGKMSFKAPAAVKYEKSIVLVKTECE